MKLEALLNKNEDELDVMKKKIFEMVCLHLVH